MVVPKKEPSRVCVDRRKRFDPLEHSVKRKKVFKLSKKYFKLIEDKDYWKFEYNPEGV